MKRIILPTLLLITLGFARASSAAVFVDDTWADGTRTNQNLPTDSAWFVSAAANVSTFTNMLSLTNIASSSTWWTYYTTQGTPIHLDVGDTMTATLKFTAIGIGAATNNSQTLRMGWYDSSTGSRNPITDSPGNAALNAGNYTGYALFVRFGGNWGNGTGMDLLRRVATANSGILTTAGDYTSVGNGGSDAGTPAFTNGGSYTLVLSFTRTNATTMSITATFSGGGLTNSLTVQDTGATGAGLISTNFDTLALRPSASSTTATNFIFTELKVEGPSGSGLAPAIVTEPQDVTRVAGEFATFSVGAVGSSLHYQWYFNTNTPIPNATNSQLTLFNIQTGDSGTYSVIITNTLNSVTSRMASLTVTTPVFATNGLVMDETWSDGDRSNGAVTSSNAAWFASDAPLLSASVGSMVGSASATTSELWVGYFTDEIVQGPVDLPVGHALRATLVFTPTNVAPKNTGTLRLGLFSYGEGGTRLAADNFANGGSGGGATNVIGYMLTLNFGTTFGDDTPLEIYARTNMTDPSLMGTTADYLSLGAGPSGQTNLPAFVSGTQYTLTFLVSRTGQTNVSVTTQITGGSLNVSLTETDTNWYFRRFDTVAIRPNRTTDSAEQFNFTRLLVEVINSPILPFSITSIQRQSPSAVAISWQSVANQTYQVQSKDSLSAATWTTNTTVTAAGSSTSYTNTGLSAINNRFYRVVATP